ncbi:MAG: hypothetical protein OXE41_01025 [Gammaproteobacteria bacterium]|nr:hypothetical protein [Gammaproteobacteria bacterium]MCY4219392.1 hypothetical protein [Gammaproteobacteria bacterium]MCY4273974.1 hypothetical protein [Gammaproteobacteria bacterium]
MLTKILFTIGVILVVILIFRTKANHSQSRSTDSDETTGSLSVKVVTIIVIVLLMGISSAIFFFQYRADNQIVNIRVINADGESTHYQARQKSIKGRQFITLDERMITLGESDRIEMNGQ